MSAKSWHWLGPALGLIGLLPQPVRGAASDFGREVRLPPLIVGDGAHALHWRLARLDRFQVLSLCSDDTTGEFIRQTYRMEHQLDWILPAEFRFQTSLPITYILCDETMQGRLDRDIPAEIFLDQFGRPKPAADQPAPAFNYFTSPNLELRDDDSLTNFALLDSEFLTLNHLIPTRDYVEYLLRQRTPPLPPWFIAGFLYIYERLSFPNVDERGRDVGVADRDGILRISVPPLFSNHRSLAAPLLPMEDILVAPHPPAGPGDAADLYNRRWTCQAALFVLSGIDPNGDGPLGSDDRKWRKSFWSFLERCSTEPVTEAMLRDCFGLGYDQMRRKLGDSPLCRTTSLSHYLGVPPEPPLVALRDANASEVARLKGDWERLETDSLRDAHSGLQNAYREHARRTLWSAYDLGDRDPGLLAAMGLFACDAGDDQAALPLLAAAVQAQVVRPTAYWELARILCAQGLAQPAGANGKLSMAQAASVLGPLAAGRRQSPPLAQAGELLADTLYHREIPPSEAELRELEKETVLFPRDFPLLSQAAVLEAQIGRIAEANRIIDRGLENAADLSTRGRLGQLRDSLANPK